MKCTWIPGKPAMDSTPQGDCGGSACRNCPGLPGLGTTVGLKDLDNSSCSRETYIALQAGHKAHMWGTKNPRGRMWPEAKLGGTDVSLAALKLQRRKGKSCVDRNGKAQGGKINKIKKKEKK